MFGACSSRARCGLALAVSLLLAVAAASPSSSSSSSSSSANDSASTSSPTAPSLSSMDVYDALGLLFMACGLALSSAGGVGGGVIMVPAMVLIMSFDIKVATPISNMGILGGAVANAWFNLRKRHPAVDRPLVDADLTLIMVPAVIGGAVIGAVLSNLLPSYLLSLLFVVVLVVGNSRMLVKGLALHKKEVAARKQAEQDRLGATREREMEAGSPPSPAAVYASVAHSPTTNPSAATPSARLSEAAMVKQPLRATVVTRDPLASDDMAEEKLAAIVQREREFPWRKHLSVMGCYMVIVAASIAGALVTCGGAAYWVLLIVEVPCVGIFTVFAARRLLKEYRAKAAVGYLFVEGDVKWTSRLVVLFPLGCVLAGIVAGMFGVGGAVVTGPMLIEMGVVPEVLSATSALMVLYSAAAATAKFAVFDMIAWDWAALLCALAFVVTSGSQIVILGYVRRTGRQSLIVLCIVTAALLGTVMMTYQAIKATIDDYDDPFSVDVCD